MKEPAPFRSLRTFLVIWLGQLVSSLGTGLGSFALGVWVYEETGSATQFSLIAFFAVLPALLLAPLAGSVADRFDRRTVLIAGNLLSALTTLVMTALLYGGLLRPWHVYPLVMTLVTLSVFQSPAFLASVSVLVPREHLARASGMSQISQSVSQILGPILAGILVGVIGFHGVILIDSVTFLFAAATLLAVRIPRPAATPAAAQPGDRRPTVAGDAGFGWRYIRTHSGLFSLMALFALTNFAVGIVQVLLTPLVLSFASPAALGTVNAVGAAGALLGGVLLSVWGGPRRRVGLILACLLAQALLLFAGGARPSVPLIAFAACAFLLTVPVINGCNQAIWQSKVPLDVQGRVFAVRQMMAMAAMPLAFLISGPLADRVFNPLLLEGGALADSVGRLIGVGPGRGIGLLFMALGTFMIAVLALAAASPRLRQVEDELPDAEPAPRETMPGLSEPQAGIA